MLIDDNIIKSPALKGISAELPYYQGCKYVAYKEEDTSEVSKEYKIILNMMRFLFCRYQMLLFVLLSHLLFALWVMNIMSWS